MVVSWNVERARSIFNIVILFYVLYGIVLTIAGIAIAARNYSTGSVIMRRGHYFIPNVKYLLMENDVINMSWFLKDIPYQSNFVAFS